MEKKHLSSSKTSKHSLVPKFNDNETPLMDNMPKRQRELDSDRNLTKSPLKMRKTNPDTSTSEYPSFIDLTFDSDDSFDGLKSSVDIVEDKENSPKKNKESVTLKNVCEAEKYGEDIIKIIKEEGKGEDCVQRQDSSWIDEIFSQFSDSDEEESFTQTTIGSQISQGTNLQTVDSGLQSLGATQASNTNEKTVESPKVVHSGRKTVDVDFHDDIDDLFDDEWDLTSKFCLDLSDFTRCKIIDIERKKMCINITVADPNPESNATALVICCGTWMDMKISIGESIIIQAKKSFGDWVVNNDWGYCVTHPDVLISGTTVAGSLFCNRKSILATRFTSINMLPNIKLTGSQAAMTTGSIVHEILQKALRDKLYTLDEIKDLCQKIIKEPSTIQLLYAADFTSKTFKETIEIYITKIHEFMERYIKGKQPNILDNNFRGQIVHIRDIEENVWAPSIGLKGKIDVTVEVKVNNRRKVMPLEIKTGRTLFSTDHKGQLYLYTMMLKLLGYEVDSGLLLYIKDNQMQEITSSVNDQRGLISIRNMLAYYLSKPAATISNTGTSEAQASWELMELPEPIYHNTFCPVCPYNTLCCVYADADKNLTLSNHHPISKISESIMEELTEAHVNYAVKWIAMVEMEEARCQENVTEDNIWITTPENREKRRTALMSLEIASVTLCDNQFHHEFVRSQRGDQEFPVKDFRQVFPNGEEYVMVSSDKRFHMASGFLSSTKKTSLVVRLDRDLTRWIKTDEIYVVDICAIRSNLYRLLGTIATLLTPNDITRRMRRLIIDKEPATFTEPIPENLKSPGAQKILSRLNKYQQQALIAVLQAKDYVLIKGMPGTGKTETLVALIELLSYLDKSVIVTAHTHNAVDNILLKLDQRNVDFMRLGTSHRLHPELVHKSEGALTKHCDSPEELGIVYDKQKVVGVTCLGASHFLLSKRIFDYCVVDECTQVLQPVLLKPLYSAFKFVFVGDPQQLPAVIKSYEARKLGMAEDIFNRLDSPNNTRALRLQYRMNQTIMNLANDFTYKGELVAGNTTVANTTLRFKCPEKVSKYEQWVQRALDSSLKNAVTVLNTGETANLIAHQRLEKNSFFKVRADDDHAGITSNWYEVVLVQRLVTALVNAGISTEEIGVIAPFKAQIKLLRVVIKEDVEINTVDQYQGRDKGVIVFSCTKSNRKTLKAEGCTEYRILEDPKRLNVAVTRAKHKIIIVGDVPMLLEYGLPTKQLFSILERHVVDLEDKIDGFSWDGLFKSLAESRSFEGSPEKP